MTPEILKSQILINTAKRTVHVHNQISASLNTGSHKLQSGFGNGDCLLLDFQNLFFAISDSTDRWPDASRDILLRLTDYLLEKPIPLPRNKSDWLNLINKLYATQQYLYRATFSGLALENIDGRKNAVIINGGDSIVLVVDISIGKIKFQTTSNMNFVGRAKCIPEAFTVPLESGHEIIIIGSDGIADIARLSKLTLEEMCIAATSRYTVDEVPYQISHLLDSFKSEIQYDDIGIIAIDPHKIKQAGKTSILMGGTMPGGEKRYSSGLRDGRFSDVWQDISQIDNDDNELAEAGIKILSV
jgi:hypothetical protein